MPFNEKIYKALARRYQDEVNSLTEVSGMTPDNPQYVEATRKLAETNRELNDHYASQRKTDENGKLTEDAVSASPNTVGDPVGTRGSYNFHFEPSVAEARKAYDQDPTLLQRLAPDWAGEAEPEREEPVYDHMSGMQVGTNRIPAVPHLDRMNESTSPYTAYAEHLWNQRRQEAEAAGKPLQRYSKVKLREQPLQYATGGIQYNVERRLAPGAFGAADSATAGTASPVYDAVLAGRTVVPQSPDEVADPMSGAPIGEDSVPQPGEYSLPTSEEVINRSPGSYAAGNIAGYAAKLNPSNLAAEGALKALNYGARSTLGKLATSAAVGGGINAAEAGIGQFARSLQQGSSPGEAASAAVGEGLMGGVVGALGGGVFDAVGQTAGNMRSAFRDREGMEGLKSLEEAGGRTNTGIRGVVPPPEVQAHVNAAKVPGALGSAQAQAAQQVAPHIQKSLEDQSRALEEKIATKKQEYFQHPAYNQQTVSSQPAIQGLVDMAQRGWRTGPVTGSQMNIDPKRIDRIGKIVQTYSEHLVVPMDQAGAKAAELNGVVLEPELGNRLFGLGGDSAAPPGHVVIAAPLPMNAQDLTGLEELIDEELQMARAAGSNRDPIWTRLNQHVKQMRDQFPYYTDEAGNLVAPPADQGPYQPYGPDERGSGEAPRVLPRPVAIEGQPSVALEATPGAGPGQDQLLMPRNPFDVQPATPQVDAPPLEPLGRADVQGEYAKPPPVENRGVGPEQSLFPRNPFDRLPEATPIQDVPPVQPEAPVVIQGEPERPNVIPPEATPGAGQWRRPLGIQAQRTQSVQGGEYAPPPTIEPDPAPAPITQRGMPAKNESPPPSERRARSGNRLDVLQDARELRTSQDAVAVPKKFLGKHLEAQGIRPDKSEDEVAEMMRQGEERAARTYSQTDQYRELTEQFGNGDLLLDLVRENGYLHGPELFRARMESAPIDQLSGNKLAMPAEEPRVPTERVARKPPTREELLPRERLPINMTLAEYEALGGKVGWELPPEVQDAVNRGILPDEAQQKAAAKNDPGYVDESLPAPTANEWQGATDELGDWYDNIVSPGRDARSGEAKRMSDLAEQQRLGDESRILEGVGRQVDDVDKRLGPISPEQRVEMLLQLAKVKLGREVTREDLIRAGLITGGAVAAVSAEDEEAGLAAAAAGVGGGKGLKQLEATLDDGTKVRGFSALRRQQHEAAESLEKNMKRVGVGGEMTLNKRVMNFNLGDDLPYDEALLEEAIKIGKEKELREAAATNVYQHLNREASFGSSKGAIHGGINALGLRLDKPLEYVSGTPRNPFAREPNTALGQMQRAMLEDPARRLTNLTGGRAGYRLDPINEALAEMIREAVFEQQQEEQP